MVHVKESLHLNDIYLYRSEIISRLEDPQLYLGKNVYKPHKTFDFPETDQYYRPICFQGFEIPE